jgi:hypothetical protein
VTGHGLKDPERAIDQVQVGEPVAGVASEVAAAIGL